MIIITQSSLCSAIDYQSVRSWILMRSQPIRDEAKDSHRDNSTIKFEYNPQRLSIVILGTVSIPISSVCGTLQERWNCSSQKVMIIGIKWCWTSKDGTKVYGDVNAEKSCRCGFILPAADDYRNRLSVSIWLICFLCPTENIADCQL